MKSLKNLFVVCVVVPGVSTLVACSVESPTYVTAQQEATGDGGASTETTTSTETSTGGKGGSSGTTDGGSGGAASTCSKTDYIAVDTSSLTACGGGKGHCYDGSKVDMGSQFVPCATAGEVCVPDELLTAGGNKLKSCTSIIPSPGGCFTASLVPAIGAMGGGALKQDVCDSGQVCIPCLDPIHGNVPSGFCEPIGAHKSSCTGGGAAGTDAGTPAPLPTCCKSKKATNGVCLSESTIPASQRDQAPQDTCSSGDKCVPAAFVSGKAVVCDGGLFGHGVCMDQCFNDMMGIAKDLGILSGKGCGSTEICIPCQFVSGKGVPTCN